MKRFAVIAIGVVVLVAVLASAAFVGGRLLNARGQATSGKSGLALLTTGGGGGKQNVSISATTAKELPAEDPTADGVFIRRADSSIFIGTGMIRIGAQRQPDGTMQWSSDYDGPEVEVVVAHDAAIYRDVTMKQFNGKPAGSGEVTVQQVVEPGTIDEIGEFSQVTVWGDKSGARLIATVVLYSLPSLVK